MAAIDVGRVCVKIAGREAGEKCVIVDIIDENFVEIESFEGSSIKNRRCNIDHLEPIPKEGEITEEAEIIADPVENAESEEESSQDESTEEVKEETVEEFEESEEEVVEESEEEADVEAESEENTTETAEEE